MCVWKEKEWKIMFIDINIRNIGLLGSVFAHGPGDWGPIPGRVKDPKNGTWYFLA